MVITTDTIFFVTATAVSVFMKIVYSRKSIFLIPEAIVFSNEKIFLSAETIVSVNEKMISGFAIMDFVSHTAVSDTKTVASKPETMVFVPSTTVEDADQRTENTKLPATVDFDHGLYSITQGLGRREDALQHRDNLLKDGDPGRRPGDHGPGYRNRGLDDQSNGLPHRDYGLLNQDAFLRSKSNYLCL
jgi:hypothetical protein